MRVKKLLTRGRTFKFKKFYAMVLFFHKNNIFRNLIKKEINIFFSNNNTINFTLKIINIDVFSAAIKYVKNHMNLYYDICFIEDHFHILDNQEEAHIS
jgi:hypothetical protein